MFRLDVQTWRSDLMFRLDVQTWCSDLMCRLDFHAWEERVGDYGMSATPSHLHLSERCSFLCPIKVIDSALPVPWSWLLWSMRPWTPWAARSGITRRALSLAAPSKRLKTLGSPWLSSNFSHAAGLRRVWKARWCSWMCICPSSCPKALKPLLQPCNLNKWMTYLPLWNSKRGCHQEPKSVALWLNKRLAAWMSSNSSFSRLPWVQDRLRKLHLGLPTFRSSAQALGQPRRHFNPCSIECQGIMSNGT